MIKLSKSCLLQLRTVLDRKAIMYHLLRVNLGKLGPSCSKSGKA